MLGVPSLLIVTDSVLARKTRYGPNVCVGFKYGQVSNPSAAATSSGGRSNETNFLGPRLLRAQITTAKDVLLYLHSDCEFLTRWVGTHCKGSPVSIHHSLCEASIPQSHVVMHLVQI